jgi:hypothetical protein
LTATLAAMFATLLPETRISGRSAKTQCFTGEPMEIAAFTGNIIPVDNPYIFGYHLVG